MLISVVLPSTLNNLLTWIMIMNVKVFNEIHTVLLQQSISASSLHASCKVEVGELLLSHKMFPTVYGHSGISPIQLGQAEIPQTLLVIPWETK